MTEPSKTRVKRAGRLLRDVFDAEDFWNDLSAADRENFDRAYDIVDWYRGSFETPLLKVRMGLQSFVKTCGYPEARVAQRLKRHPRIVQKLARFPNMQLTTMQDIGGCRVIVPSLEALADLRGHVRKRWRRDIIKEDDYVESPQESGYRAIHVVVRRDSRPIEVQLRTMRQHEWADTVEALSRRTGVELKWGGGSEIVAAMLRHLADAMASRDRGEALSPDVRKAIDQLVLDADNMEES